MASTPSPPTTWVTCRQRRLAAQAVITVSNPPPPPVPPVITGEHAIFTRKTNKKGKPTGKPILTGFELDFSTPLDQGTANESSQLPTRQRHHQKGQEEVDDHPQADHQLHRLLHCGKLKSST